MNFDYTPKVQELRDKLLAFFDAHIYPNERAFIDEIAANRANGNAWIPTGLIEALKDKAREAGLWNLFLPASDRGAGLTNLEYAPLCEIMGRVPWAPEVFNCNAPDTGNMETIERYGSDEQKQQWLEPLLARRDPLGVPDDGAGRGVVGCDEHSVQHHARWRQLRDQRPQMVVVGRGRSALQGLYRDGQDGPAGAEASAAIDDPRSGGRERRHRASALERVRLRRRAARSHGHHARRTCACPHRISCSARDAASRSRKDASDRAASTTACA